MALNSNIDVKYHLVSQLKKDASRNYVAFRDSKEYAEVTEASRNEGYMTRTYFSDADMDTTNWTGIVEFWK